MRVRESAKLRVRVYDAGWGRVRDERDSMGENEGKVKVGGWRVCTVHPELLRCTFTLREGGVGGVVEGE